VTLQNPIEQKSLGSLRNLLALFLLQVSRKLCNSFVIITGQCAYVTTPEATLPSRSLLKLDLPLVPTTIMSTLCCCAYSTILPAINGFTAIITSGSSGLANLEQSDVLCTYAQNE